MVSVCHDMQQWKGKRIPFQYNFGPTPASLHQRLDFILAGRDIPISVHKVPIFHLAFDLLQLVSKTIHFSSRELVTQMTSISYRKLEEVTKSLTFERVLTADVERRIETSVSCV